MSGGYGIPEVDMDSEANFVRLGEHMRIKEFHGNINAEEVLTYIDAVTAQCSVMGAVTGITWLKVFEMHLQDTARRWYTKYKIGQEAANQLSVEQTVADFKSRFLPTGYQEIATEKIIALKQSGPVSVYCDRFEQLRELLPRPLQTEGTLQILFIRGLDPAIRTTVRNQRPVDLTDCYRHAQWADEQREPDYRRRGFGGSRQRNGRPLPGKRAPLVTRELEYEDRMDLDAMAAEPHKNNRRTTTGNPQGCFLCGEKGHFKRDCPQNGRTTSRKQ